MENIKIINVYEENIFFFSFTSIKIRCDLLNNIGCSFCRIIRRPEHLIDRHWYLPATWRSFIRWSPDEQVSHCYAIECYRSFYFVLFCVFVTRVSQCPISLRAEQLLQVFISLACTSKFCSTKSHTFSPTEEQKLLSYVIMELVVYFTTLYKFVWNMVRYSDYYYYVLWGIWIRVVVACYESIMLANTWSGWRKPRTTFMKHSPANLFIDLRV
jgi:hypothetical protein